MWFWVVVYLLNRPALEDYV
jgi:hypothetical protein